MSSASDEFDENDTDINQYLSQDLVGVIKRIKFVGAKGSEKIPILHISGRDCLQEGESGRAR